MLEDPPSSLGPELIGALEKKGFTSLTSVQLAVLDPALAGRDLRVTSQTGSGKTVAIGFAIRQAVEGETVSAKGAARPLALVVAPTRELARQVEEELAWLYAGMKIRVTSVTGGTSVRDERRGLTSGPGIIVGTPGRLLDHLERGSIDGSQLRVVVLDEADRLLDMGFRDDLEKIMSHAPEGHTTHLVSATFPREVRALADRVQKNPAHVEGTRLGAANVDIDHVIHLVAMQDRVGAVINLLLAHEGEQTLVFARTRADVARIADSLYDAGFKVAALSGEMEQRARERALAEFKTGDLDALVATDVAARGIDVQDIARVVHVEPPADADTYTHRSGRTGRAGKKGTSAVLVAPSALVPTLRVLGRAGVSHRFDAIPSADDIRDSRNARFEADLIADDPEGFPGFGDRTWELAKRLSDRADATRTIARLFTLVRKTRGREPADIRIIPPPVDRTSMRDRPGPRDFRSQPRTQPPPRLYGEGAEAPREDRRDYPPPDRAPRAAKPHNDGRTWVTFRVSWGEAHGADTRRMLPVMCRRGEVQGTDIGAIRIGRLSSTVEVASDVAVTFAEAAGRPDPRDPRITIARDDGGFDAAPQPREPSPRPRASYGDAPRAPHSDAPRYGDAPRAPHNDAPRPAYGDAPRAPHSDAPRAPAPPRREYTSKPRSAPEGGSAPPVRREHVAKPRPASEGDAPAARPREYKPRPRIVSPAGAAPPPRQREFTPEPRKGPAKGGKPPKKFGPR